MEPACQLAAPRAQMPFGSIEQPAGDKTFIDDDVRFGPSRNPDASPRLQAPVSRGLFSARLRPSAAPAVGLPPARPQSPGPSSGSGAVTAGSHLWVPRPAPPGSRPAGRWRCPRASILEHQAVGGSQAAGLRPADRLGVRLAPHHVPGTDQEAWQRQPALPVARHPVARGKSPGSSDPPAGRRGIAAPAIGSAARRGGSPARRAGPPQTPGPARSQRPDHLPRAHPVAHGSAFRPGSSPWRRHQSRHTLLPPAPVERTRVPSMSSSRTAASRVSPVMRLPPAHPRRPAAGPPFAAGERPSPLLSAHTGTGPTTNPAASRLVSSSLSRRGQWLGHHQAPDQNR